MKKGYFLLFMFILLLFVLSWIIPYKIKNDENSHIEYIERMGYENVEFFKINKMTYSVYYIATDKKTKEIDTLQIRYSKNGVYSLK